jgi:hypothetical protein
MRGKRKAASATKSKCTASCCMENNASTSSDIGQKQNSLKTRSRKGRPKLPVVANTYTVDNDSDSASEETVSVNLDSCINDCSPFQGHTGTSKKKRTQSPTRSRPSDLSDLNSESSDNDDSLLDEVLDSSLTN